MCIVIIMYHCGRLSSLSSLEITSDVVFRIMLKIEIVRLIMMSSVDDI